MPHGKEKAGAWLFTITAMVLTCLIFFLSVELSVRTIYCLKDHEIKVLYYGAPSLELLWKKVFYEGRANVRFALKKALYKFKILKPGKEILIMAFGGSTTEGHTITPNYAYPPQLEQKLKDKYSHVRVINCGAGGLICSRLYYSRFLDKIAYLGIPSIAIIHTGINDAYNLYHINEHNISDVNADYFTQNFFIRLDKTLYQYSLAYSKAKEIYRKHLSKKAGPETESIDFESFDRLVESRFKKYLEEIVIDAKVFKIKLILSTEPVSDKMLENKKFMYGYNKVLEAIRAVSIEYGVPLVDFEKSFREMGNKNSFFVDEIHLNKEGNAYLAEEYKKLIETAKMLE